MVAIGETGLDFHYRHSPDEDQERRVPPPDRAGEGARVALVVHSRAAWDDTFRILDDEGLPERTVLHCFTGGPDEASRALDLGAWLSFSGIVSFRNADDVRAAAALTPARPAARRDRRARSSRRCRTGASENEPALVPLVGAAVAAARGIDPATVAELTRTNAAHVFGLDR